MSSIEITRLSAADLGLLASVTDAVFDHAVDSIQAAAFLDDPAHEMVVAIDAGVVVGMASAVVMLHPDKQPQLFINEVGVDEVWRRRGIGTLLVQALLDIADERSCSGSWLATELDNEAARGLYAKLGARETVDTVVYDWDVEL